MGKRKRGEQKSQKHYEGTNGTNDVEGKNGQKEKAGIDSNGDHQADVSKYPVSVQIIVGTYEKVLHGISATISNNNHKSAKQQVEVTFADAFLLSTHTSAIRCLALSPQASNGKLRKLLLATGSSDQTINLYQLSTEAPSSKDNGNSLPTLTGHKVHTSADNRELGSLQHHAGAINQLHFPSRSKLISTAEDCTIAITRTRDWTMLSTIKTPMPKVHGRPSGDTAPLGGVPSGVNSFAIHPSMKLMVSASKGEKCMRLWNLITGRKAGILNFEKAVLQRLGEGRWTGGEGRQVRWNAAGEEFLVVFERGCIVYGLDSKIRCVLLTNPTTRIHQVRYITIKSQGLELVAASTDDGRIIFFSTLLTEPRHPSSDSTELGSTVGPIFQLEGDSEGPSARIKDFEALKIPKSDEMVIVAASSDGAIRLWIVSGPEFSHAISLEGKAHATVTDDAAAEKASSPIKLPKVGKHIGTYEAGKRITCLTAFVMTKDFADEPMAD